MSFPKARHNILQWHAIIAMLVYIRILVKMIKESVKQRAGNAKHRKRMQGETPASHFFPFGSKDFFTKKIIGYSRG